MRWVKGGSRLGSRLGSSFGEVVIGLKEMRNRRGIRTVVGG